MADEGGDRELPQRSRGEVTAPSVRGRNSLAGTRPPAPRVGGADATVTQQPPRAANAGPVTEDEVTEWLGTAGQSPAGAEAGTVHEAEPESASWLGAGIAALIVIPALVIGSLAVVAVRHFSGTHDGRPPTAAPARQEAAAVRGEAAAWVIQQVRRDVTVSCDQAMCAALEARGLPASDLLVLGPISPDPRHSDVVVETAAVRALFGTSLDRAWAPAVLASFGSGSGSSPRMAPSRTRPRWSATWPPGGRRPPGCWPAGGSASRRPPGPSSPRAWSTCGCCPPSPPCPGSCRSASWISGTSARA